MEPVHPFRHFAVRSPKKAGGFSWGRALVRDGHAVSYRLFRRDSRGRVHALLFDYQAGAPRSGIARDLMRARRTLRDRVDEIDLALMEGA